MLFDLHLLQLKSFILNIGKSYIKLSTSFKNLLLHIYLHKINKTKQRESIITLKYIAHYSMLETCMHYQTLESFFILCTILYNMKESKQKTKIDFR